MGSVSVETHGASQADNAIRLIVAATGDLTYKPNVTSQGYVVVPHKERRMCEAAIENAANLLAISEGVRRSIASPTPCVALIPTSDNDQKWLEDKRGFHFPKCDRQTVWFDQGLNALEHIEVLADRMDGVTLLAEAVGHNHLSGKFHEYMRLFELAFRRSSKLLIDPLAAFLSLPIQGYTRDEISSWIVDVRHPLTHADTKNYFLTEGDIQPIIHRVEQAAYDVLLNKTYWRDPRPDRRSQWSPDAVIGSDGPIINQHSAPTLHSQILDDLYCYGRDMGAFINQLPAGWWVENASE